MGTDMGISVSTTADSYRDSAGWVRDEEYNNHQVYTVKPDNVQKERKLQFC